MQKGVHGSVQIHIHDGEITQVNDNTGYNTASFIDHVEKSLSRVVVKTCAKTGTELIKNNVTDVEKVGENGDNSYSERKNAEKYENIQSKQSLHEDTGKNVDLLQN